MSVTLWHIRICCFFTMNGNQSVSNLSELLWIVVNLIGFGIRIYICTMYTMCRFNFKTVHMHVWPAIWIFKMAQVVRINAGIRTSKVICHAKWQSARYDNPRQRTYAYRMRLSISCGLFVKTLRISIESSGLTYGKGIIFCFEILHLVCASKCVAVGFAGYQLLPLLKLKIARTIFTVIVLFRSAIMLFGIGPFQ